MSGHATLGLEQRPDASSKRISYNRPQSQLLEAPYTAPPEPTNPVVRGLQLYYGASLISSVNAVSAYLWSNAGFTLLRNIPELRNHQPRFDPTVIPAHECAVDASPAADSSLALRGRLSSGRSNFPSVADYHAAYASGALTPLDIVETLLPLVRRDVSAPTPHSTAFIEVQVDMVRAAAEASTARWKAGTARGLLDGVPIAIKDEVDVEGLETKFGSKRVSAPTESSWCVKKLVEAGAIILGKSSMHELGIDTTNNNPTYGTPLNPYHQGYYCGGSSGGSAYSVGAGLVPLALGADAGGSIRIPASFCGIYGLKTSHGRVSRLPTPNLAASCGVIGPMGANMLDIEIGFRAMATSDPAHATSGIFSKPLVANLPPKIKMLGVYTPWVDRANPVVQDAYKTVLDYFRDQLDYQIVDITIPFLHAGQIAHALTCLTELAAGHPGSVADLQPANKILISVGRHTLASDYLLAQRLRELLMKHLAALFDEHPGMVIVTPTTPLPGWRIADPVDLKYGVSDANMSVRNMEFVWMANFCGCPCLQIPAGYTDLEGGGKLPIGLMGMTEWGKDEEAISWGYDGERWLNEGLKGGRQQPQTFVDILKTARSTK
ncbi:amidase signature enzyme [Massariosphaeria phaeospora]|uniref:Amidase signature enzyme n=1 Tax=Massariosphaeria phaeospora TaxID=100035 RepID=A0A7C8M1F9_9PLEO|nr:amidase signature enzyme [Massariosphaeria phaeospora]